MLSPQLSKTQPNHMHVVRNTVHILINEKQILKRGIYSNRTSMQKWLTTNWEILYRYDVWKYYCSHCTSIYFSWQKKNYRQQNSKHESGVVYFYLAVRGNSYFAREFSLNDVNIWKKSPHLSFCWHMSNFNVTLQRVCFIIPVKHGNAWSEVA